MKTKTLRRKTNLQSKPNTVMTVDYIADEVVVHSETLEQNDTLLGVTDPGNGLLVTVNLNPEMV